MRYDDFRHSDNIDDRRDDSGGGMGGGMGIPMGGGGGLGIGTIIVLGLLGYAFGIDPRILIGGAEILTGGNTRPDGVRFFLRFVFRTDADPLLAALRRGGDLDEDLAQRH